MLKDSSLTYAAHPPPVEDLRPGAVDALWWLLDKWPHLIGASLLGAALAFGGSLAVAPRYEATTSLFVDNRSLQPLVTPPGQAPSGDNNSEVSFVESQVKIVTSRSVLARVVAAQHLDTDPEFGGVGEPSAFDRLRAFVGVAGPPASADDRSLVAQAALADRITVRRPERTFIIDVSVRARSSSEAARLANAVAQAYLDEQDAAHAEAARRASGALTGRLDELRKRLEEAEGRVQAFKDQHGLVGTRLQLSSEQQLTEANAELAQARAQRVRSRAHLDELSAPRPDGLGGSTPEATLSPTISLLRGKQADARRQLASALTQFGPRHPAVRDAKDQLADVDRSIGLELERIRQAARIEFKRASAAEATAGNIVDRLSSQASETGSALARLAQLQQEVEIDKGLLNTFLSRAQETGEMERLDPVSARVISVAEPPLRRVSPPRGLVMAVFGAGLGFWCAAAWIVLDRLGWWAVLRHPQRPSMAGLARQDRSMSLR